MIEFFCVVTCDTCGETAVVGAEWLQVEDRSVFVPPGWVARGPQIYPGREAFCSTACLEQGRAVHIAKAIDRATQHANEQFDRILQDCKATR